MAVNRGANAVGSRKSDLKRRGRKILLFCLLLSFAPALSGAEGESGKLAFPLEKVPALDATVFGHTCVCRDQPEPNVVYPRFSCGKPLYGVMRVDMEFANSRSGTPYQFALDESGGTGAGYDRLYVDLNRDGRLVDETPSAPLRELPPGGLFKRGQDAPAVWFDYITFSSTDAAGTHSVQTLPRLLINPQGLASVSFIATKAYQGKIEIAQRQFHVVIRNGYPLGTRWDRPGTLVKLEAHGGARMPYWFGSDRLMALHRMGDRYWRFSLTPEGDRLFAEPYEGPLGILQIDLGGQFLRETTFCGSLFAKDWAVGVGQDDQHGNYLPVRSCEVPVGDYDPALLAVRYGLLGLSLSNNVYTDGISGGCDPNSAYILHVGKDKPCVLDLSRKAKVLFAAPGPRTRLKPGDTLQVTAVLVDPKSEVMIRSLCRLSRERASSTTLAVIGLIIVGPLGVWIAAGRSRRRYRYLPLFSGIGLLALACYLGGLFALNAVLHPNRPGRQTFEDLAPRVTIARANGDIIAEGVMPFG